MLPAHCGQCHPWAGGPRYYTKAGWAWGRRSKPVSCVPLWTPLQFLPLGSCPVWVSILTSHSYILWPGNVNGYKPLPSYVAFDQNVLSRWQNTDRNGHEGRRGNVLGECLGEKGRGSEGGWKIHTDIHAQSRPIDIHIWNCQRINWNIFESKNLPHYEKDMLTIYFWFMLHFQCCFSFQFGAVSMLGSRDSTWLGNMREWKQW